MRNRLMMKASAILLAASIALTSVPMTVFATGDMQTTTQVVVSTDENTAQEVDNKDTSDATNNLDQTDETTDIKDKDEVSETDDSNKTEDTIDVDSDKEGDSIDNPNTAEDTNTVVNPSDIDNTNSTDTSIVNPDATVVSSDEEEKEVQSKEDKTEEDIIERNTGYHSIDDLKIPTLYDGTYVPNNKGALPASYDSRNYGYITPIRDQGGWGSCWSFSAMAMAEANLVKKGLADRTLDLSELQLAYFFYHSVADPLGNTAGDSTKALTDNYLDQGGNSAFTTFALASWVGAANEAKAPYGNATSEDYALDASLAYDDDYHMQNAYWINMLDKEDVKSMIMQYGAVGTSYYAAHNGNSTTKYYNGDTKALFYDGSYYADHAIIIVGWDDSFPTSNFNAGRQPKNSGAWLVKNSWGPEFGDAGYFWISYEDGSLTDPNSSQAFVFDFESADNYDHNYQYDGSYGAYGSSVSNGGNIANVFTAKANPSGGAEKIEAVSFALYDVNVDYSIQVYSNLADSQNPTSGTARLSTPKTGQTSYVGYYTVKLDNPVEIVEGTSFSVVITLSRSAADEVNYFCDYSYTNGGWIQFKNSTQYGQSFVRDASNRPWADIGSVGATARIKAFTTDTVVTQPTQIALSQSSLTLKAGESASLTATTSPISVGPESIMWNSSDESVAKVDTNGTVTATGVGEATVTVSTTGGLSATCKVTGKIGKVTNLEASQTTNRIKLSWDKQNGVSGYEIYRYNNGTRKYEKIATNTKASKNTYSDKSKEEGTNYQYKVRAYIKGKKKNTYGSYSSILKTATKTSTPRLTGNGESKKVKLSWGKIDKASGYEIYMSTKKSSDYTKIKTIGKVKTVSYTKKGLEKNKKYYFKIRAYKKVNGTKIYSGYSKVVTVKAK